MTQIFPHIIEWYLLHVWNIQEGDLRVQVARDAECDGRLVGLVQSYRWQAVEDVDEEEVEVDLRLIVEVNDWEDVLLRDVLQEWHHPQQGVVYLAEVLLKERECMHESFFAVLTSFLELVLDEVPVAIHASTVEVTQHGPPALSRGLPGHQELHLISSTILLIRLGPG